jgi:hypothetical protein
MTGWEWGRRGRICGSGAGRWNVEFCSLINTSSLFQSISDVTVLNYIFGEESVSF